MRVAIVHYAAPPVIGGVESVVAAHARLMAADGHDVRLVAGRGDAHAGGSVESPGEVIIVPLVDPVHDRIVAMQAELGAGRVPATFDALVAELRRDLAGALEGADVIFAHNVCSLSLNLALTAALRELVDQAGSGGPRFVLWHHDVAATRPDYQATL